MLYEKCVKSGSGSEHVDVGTSYGRFRLSLTAHIDRLSARVLQYTREPLHRQCRLLGINPRVVCGVPWGDGCRLLISRQLRRTIPPWWCPEIADNGHGAKLPEIQFDMAFLGHIYLIINGEALALPVTGETYGERQADA
jgi:hypothetical protein